MKERIEALRARWSGLPSRTRALAIGGAAALAALIGLGTWLASDSPMQVLFAELSSDDSGRIVEELGRLQVPYDLEEGGATVLVPANRVHELRLSLAAAGLPSGGSTGFELFDEQRFGESEFSERVKYHRALEGELQRTISHLGGVERARVHLVLPTRSVFVDDENEGSASVVLHMQPGRRVSREQAQGIVHLVASSVRGISAENVAVVDGDGRPVAEGSGDEEIGDALAYRRRVETERERAARELLDRTLGPGIAEVRVAADVSFTREERTEERYHPDEVATRSFEIEEETRADETNTAEGVPGAASNLPGGEAVAAGTSTNGGGRRHETRNFEISKTIRRAVEPLGRIERLQVAVVVDGTWTGEGASRTFEPRPAEELDRIREVVAHAVGVVETRGDGIAVSCVPFAARENPVEDPVEALLAPYRPWLEPAGVLLATLVGLITLLMIRRRLRARQARAELVPDTTIAQLARGDQDPNAPPRALPGADELRAALTAPDDATRIPLLAAELAAEDPARAARVLRGWLLEARNDEPSVSAS